MPTPSYLTGRYLTVVCSDGSLTRIAPWEALRTTDGRTPVSVALADNLLNAVAVEMLAGFLQAFAPPENEAEWAATWDAPPSPDDLRKIFEPAAARFDIRGPCPAFQDARISDAELRPLGKLFHAVPGDASFCISEEAAMVALYAMQAHAYGGGRGYRTSLCGGGPLRTVPVAGETLFHRAWALVLPKRDFEALGQPTDDPGLIYPWTGETKSADVIGRGSHPATTLYWAVPRRFLLPDATRRGPCPITGQDDAALIEGIREKDGGPSYPSELWMHPLTPYTRDAAKGTSAPIRAVGFPDGIGWRHRAGLVASTGGDAVSAQIVRVWTTRARRLGMGHIRLHAYGARCDNAKVLGYLDSVQPYRLAPEAHEAAVEAEMRGAAKSADEARRGLRSHLGEALRRDPSRDDWQQMGDVLDEAASAFWASTEAAADSMFDATADALASEDGQDARLTENREAFVRSLRRCAIEVFDRMTESARDQDPAHFGGRRDSLNGIPFWPSVRTALGLAVPEHRKPTKEKQGGGKAKSKEKSK